jgi:hypothetical protein
MSNAVAPATAKFTPFSILVTLLSFLTNRYGFINDNPRDSAAHKKPKPKKQKPH